MAIKTDTFASSAAAGTDNLDDVTSRGATTTNAITVGGVTVGTEYSLPTLDGSANQVLQTNGTGTVSFATLDFTGGLEYKGAFNATAGTPSLTNAEKGDFYIIDTAGTIYGQTWAVGDHLLINEDMGGTITNSKIDKIDNTQAVTSVNTQTGAVVLSGNDLLADHTADNYTAANNNIDGHLSGIDSALGAVASPTLDDVTTNGDTTTNAINVGTITTSGDILADTNASRTIGAEATRFITYHGDMNGAIRFKAKNNQGSAITKGQAVYISGVSGTVPEVKLAQANSALTMPAFGLALANANDQAEVQVITFGNLTDYNTTTYSLSANDTVYISATTAGALTNSAPTGESNLIQNIGRVVRADASAGIIKVGGAGRSNATPNLDQDKIFLGNASNQSVSTALSSIALSSFNDDLSYLSSGDNVSLLTNDAGYLTGITGESIGDLSDVTVTSAVNGEVLKYNGTAWVDASVDYTEVTNTPTNVSTFTNDAGYLTGITGESIGDLSDVTVTTPSNGQVLSYNGTNWVNSASSAGSLSGLSDTSIGTPVNGEVLKYNGTAWVDAQLAYSELSGTPTNVSTFTNDANYVASGDNVSVFTNDAGYLTGITGESIGDLSDVTVTSATSGEVLKYNGTAWVDASVDYTEVTNTPTNVSTFTNDSGYLTGITGESIGSLSDVTVTSVASGEVLKYNGTAWVNDTISAGGGYTYSAITADPANAQYDYHYSCTGTFTVTLPASASGDAGKEIRIKNMGTGTITVDGNASETIDGQTTIDLNTQYSSITLIATGNTPAAWEIV